jgi:hypothetical protein
MEEVSLFKSKYKWIALAVGVKFLFYFYCMLFVYHGEHKYIPSEDGTYYLSPSDNLVDLGVYRCRPEEPSSFYRHPPGMTMLYLPLRWILPAEPARFVLVLVQTFLEGLSVYFLAMLSWYLFKRKRIAITVFWLYLFSPYISAFSPHILSESLCITCIIFALYFLARYFLYGKTYQLVLSSLLMVEAFFLRPVMILIFIFAFLWLVLFLYKQIKTNPIRFVMAKLFLPVTAFVLPFVFVFSIWTGIVYKESHGFHPQGINNWVHAPLDKPEVNPAVIQYYAFNWIRNVGEDMVYYRPGTLGAWFMANELYSEEHYVIPKHIYTSHFQEKEVIALRASFAKYWMLTNGDSTGRYSYAPLKGSVEDSLGHYLKQVFINNVQEYKQEKPFRYYIIDPLILTFHLLANNGTHTLDWPSFSDMLHKDPMMLPLKILTGISYLLILLCYLPASIIMLLRRNMHYHWFFVMGAALILIHSCMLRIIDERFMATAYPFMLVGTAVLFSALTNLVKPEEETKFP